MVSLAKRSHMRLDWEGASGQRVTITASEQTGGIATIYEFDILLWAISQINAAVELVRNLQPRLLSALAIS